MQTNLYSMILTCLFNPYKELKITIEAFSNNIRKLEPDKIVTQTPQVPISTLSSVPNSTSSSTHINISASTPTSTPMSTPLSTPVTLPINPLDRQLIGSQSQTINLTPNNENADNSLINLFGGSNGWPTGPQIGSQSNFFTSADTLTQSRNRPVASTTTASTPGIIFNQPNNTGNPFYQYPYIYFSPYSNHVIQEMWRC